jgi:hypothetical protein
MWWRTGWIPAACLVVATLPARGQGGPEVSAGAGPVVPAGGANFEYPGAFDDVAPSLSAAVRWHIREVASVGIVIEWARFPYTESGDFMGVAREGSRRYVGVGAAARRYVTPDRAAPRPFLGVGLGVAVERFSEGQVCTDDMQTSAWPCEWQRDDRGTWMGAEAGVSIHVGSGLSVELSATLSAVIMGVTSGIGAPSPSDDAGWVGIRLAVAGPLW